MIIVVMGVSGAGKTTVGSLLADALQCEYLDADALHSAENIAAMARGEPLDDSDRAPWLVAVHARISEAHGRGQTLVVGCSALRRSYRETLAEGVPVIWVYLRGAPELIRERLDRRAGHFADERILDSQLATLEEPRDAIVVDIALPPAAIVEQVLVRVSGSRALHILGADELGARTAAAVAATIRAVVASTGRCSLVLSGGDTPRAMHHALATRHGAEIPWSDVHVFWSDERYVPPDDARSNYGMARATLLDHVPSPPGNIHSMPTWFDDPGAAARAYEDVLTNYFRGAPPSFDIAVLGVGEDGHTASLFPHADALHERERRVLAVRADVDPPLRLTFTLPALLACARNWFLVGGKNKARAVRDVLRATQDDAEVLPAAAVLRARGDVTWWLDHEAASLLDPEIVRDAAY